MSVYTLSEIIAKDASESERVALIYGDRRQTYSELVERSGRLAGGLAAAGLRHGDRVCVLMHNRIEFVELFFAIARLGCVLVPVNHLLTAREVAHVVRDSGAGWFVAQDALWPTVQGLCELLDRPPELIAVGAPQPASTAYETLLAPDPAARADVCADDTLLLQYTSGTTGFPKGAIHTHSTVMWNAISQREHFAVDSTSVYICLPALSWVAGFHSLHLATLWAGGTVVLHPTDSSFSATEFCAAVARHGATSVALVPTVLRRILEAPDVVQGGLDSLRVAIVGGESVPVHLLEAMTEQLPQVQVFQVYGMSEFPSLVTLLAPADGVAKIGSAGKANCVSAVRVVDPDDRDLPAGQIGEILTRSPATMRGYYGLPNETAAALRGGWFHTGDLGYLDDDGFLFISGRSKDVIISGGLNIYPAEVEHILARHDAIVEVAIVGDPDDRWGEVARAVVVVAPGVELTESELHSYLEPQVARYKIPKVWELRSGPPLPRTASGKLQKFKLH